MIIADIVLTTAVLLMVVASVQPLARRTGLPFTVVLAVVGVLIGLAALWVLRSQAVRELDEVAEMVIDIPVSSATFLTILLPLLLFQGAITIDVRRLAQDIAAVVLLAVLAVVVALVVIGGAVYLVAPMPLVVCLLFGAIVATTDPSAVIALFRDLGAPARLTRLVEGESLLNDATAIAAFGAFLTVVVTGQDLNFWMVTEDLAWRLSGGILVGLLAGRAAAQLLSFLRSYRGAQITVTVALPYVVYVLCNNYLEVSGVVAVVASGLVLSAVGRSRFQPEAFQFCLDTLEQLAYWATSLVFVLAAILVPRLLEAATLADLLYLLVAVLAALVARAVILFGVFPLLSAARVVQKVTTPMKTVIIWGGLRGSVTLALALAVTENLDVEPEVKSFIAIQATGFALFTLLVQGTTLSPLMRWLGLDQLSPIDRAFRSQVLTQSLSSVRSNLRSFAGRYELDDDLVDQAVRPYSDRLSRVAEDNSFAEELSDRERLTVGLIALANQEKALIVEQRWSGGLASPLIDRYLLTVGAMIDGAREGGRLGYLRAARMPYKQTWRFRLLGMAHSRLGISRPLATYLGRRFQYLLVNRILLLELVVFLEFRLGSLLGDRLTELLGEIVNQRLTEVERHIDALRLQYPNFARDLDHAVLERYAYREEIEQVVQMREAGIISEDLARHLRSEAEDIYASRRRSGAVDIRVTIPELLRAFPVFSNLGEDDLKRVAKRLQERVFAVDAFVFKRGERADGMYFIANGAVEIAIGETQHRLGRGDFFGEMGLLDQSRRSASVRSISYSHLLFLPRAAFEELGRSFPQWRSKLAEVARDRRQMNLRATEAGDPGAE
ncbi:cation:proton antiporter [Pelagibius sp. CAU 1746]|uniref:cation:proton antiporter n=1 Tax=Pelagibius sp. CAU 1746 TaxID=3140370 RepID=UPI00325BCFF9